MANGSTRRVRESVGEIAAARKRHPASRSCTASSGHLATASWTWTTNAGCSIGSSSRFQLALRRYAIAAYRAAGASRRVNRVHALATPTDGSSARGSRVPFDRRACAGSAAAHGVAMEINARPTGSNLSRCKRRLALERGCRFVTNRRARDGQLDHLRSVCSSGRAGITKGTLLKRAAWEKFRSVLAPPRAERRPEAAEAPGPEAAWAARRPGGARAREPARSRAAQAGRAKSRSRTAGQAGCGEAQARLSRGIPTRIPMRPWGQVLD